MAKTKFQTIPLNGKLITAFDGAIIGVSDTQVQKNLRYNDGYIQGVRGMTKINTAAHATYRQFKTGIHFQKENPYETHILCQAADINGCSTAIIDNKTAPPAQGNFESTVLRNLIYGWTGGASKLVGDIVVPSTGPNGYYYECLIAGTTHASTEPTWSTTELAVQTDGSVTWLVRRGTLDGHFALAPDSTVVFCNGDKSLIYGGDEMRCGAFFMSTAWSSGVDATTLLIDDTDRVTNSLVTATEVSTMTESSDNIVYLYIGFTRPVKGIKFYVQTPNATTGTMVVKYWGSSGFTSVTTLSDGTASGGVSFAQTGSVTFDDTMNAALPRIINNTMAYWYQVYWGANEMDETTTVWMVTGNASMQVVRDLWDGSYRDISKAMFYDATSGTPSTDKGFEDCTTALLKQDADFVEGTLWNLISSTALDMRGSTTADALYLGFEEPMMGIFITMPMSNYLGATKYLSRNTATATLTVSYWDGEGWTACGSTVDGTYYNSRALSQSGLISWNYVTDDTKTTINNGMLLHWYKVTWSKTLSGYVGIDMVQGVPRPRSDLSGYIFPLNWADSLWLCGKQAGAKNEMTPSAPDTVTVWNTDTTVPIYLGDDSPLRAGTTIYSQFGGTIYDTAIIVKDRETWILNKRVGEENTSAANKYRAARKYGCNAPYSLDSCDLGTESSQGMQKAVAIWQSNTGLVMFDGNAMTMISDDIWNLFRDMYDTSTNERVHPDYAYKSQGFFDPFYKEYHWMFADGSSTGDVNRELCYDVVRKKWFEIVRGTGKELQTGFGVWSREGNAYAYGGIKTGYLERLEYGTTHDGTAITYKFRLSDSALAKDDMGLWKKVRLERVELIMKSKNTTGEYINVTLYADGKTVGTDLPKMYMSDADHRFVIAIKPTSGYAVFCTLLSLEFDVTTDDEQMGFTPYAIGIAYTEQVDDLVEK